MEELRFSDDETERFVDNTALKIRIEDFRAASEPFIETYKNPHPLVRSFYASVYPNGADKETKGWLVVRPGVEFHEDGWIPANDVLTCIVSIIDIEGSSRLQRSFEGLTSDATFKDGKYLERSFILNRADEFLPEGSLTMLCDFYFTWTGLRIAWDVFRCDDDIERCPGPDQIPDTDFFSSIPQVACFKNDAETENSIDSFTVFDFTSKILTLPQFHESRKRFGVYGVPPGLSPAQPELKEDSAEFLESVWMFDSRPDRFLLPLDEPQDNMGGRLMEASPVIRTCVNAPVKEQNAKEENVEFMDQLMEASPVIKICENPPMKEHNAEFMDKLMEASPVIRTCKNAPVKEHNAKEDNAEFLENVWIFDTSPDRFLLSLDESQDNLGSRLMEASPVIRACVNAPMKEHGEKRIELKNVDSNTFKIVLYFLEKGTLPHSEFHEVVDVYKMSHLYEIENLQRNCAEHMVKLCGPPTKSEDLKRIAGLYSDEYLSSLLDSYRPEYANVAVKRQTVIKDDRLDSHCYV